MIGASKILTVSYGTFSCTLEGFDDPFNTMRAIAEYFRDLAADDRYFGAEPATPDAAMLHKIAEREINRRVEAQVGDNGVLLRAEEAPMPRVTMPGMQTQAPVFAPGVAPSVASVAEAAPAAESAAARLSRLRAAQAQILAPAPAATLGDISSRFADVEAYAEDQDAETAFKPAEPAPVAPVAPPVTPAAAVEIPVEAPVAVAPAATETEDFADESQADEDLIASLGQSGAPAEPQAVAAPVAAEDVSDSLRETLAGLIGHDDQLAEDMASASEATADAAAQAATDSGDAMPEDVIDDLTDLAQFDMPAQVADQSDLDDLSALDDQSPLIDDAAYLPAEAAAPVEEIATVEEVEGIAVADQPVAELSHDDDQQPAIEVSPDAPVVSEKIERARARVIKIRRMDKRAASDQPAAATLSPEAEADLQNTLNALAAEIAPVAAANETVSVKAEPDADPSDTAADTKPAGSENANGNRLGAADDAAVDRLLAHTNSELEVPEIKRRRSAIAHLKAAVLATVADRRKNPRAQAEGVEVKMDPYRKDLNQAVRPTTAPLATTDRPAPLVLVSAQRIDRKRDAVADANRPVPQIVASAPPAAQAAPVMPVRPRRVGASSGGLAQAVSTEMADDEDHEMASASAGNIFADGNKQSFAEFAETLGATSIAELLEAAGAYCTLVLDRPSFSRPLLFEQISSMPERAELNREEGLRGFGKLLRDGRIQKSVRGQFALSETSPILTEAKRIAG